MIGPFLKQTLGMFQSDHFQDVNMVYMYVSCKRHGVHISG
jgi:hypothetical protein